MSPLPSSSGMCIFGIVWFGQFISLIGSGLTSFVLGLWVYQLTGSVTQFALILLSGTLPRILLSPLAGALADRWDRRWMMLLSDAGSGLSVLSIALLFFTHQLAIWQIYVATAAGAICGTFQFPAYVATTTLLVPKQQLGRANGMLQLGLAAQDILAPLLAGILIAAIQLGGVLIIDVATFCFAVFTLLIVRFPSPVISRADRTGNGSLLREAFYGWSYIVARPGLLGLLVFFAATSFINGMIGALIYPLILAFTTATQLSFVVSIAGGGMLLCSLVMSAWSGPKSRIGGVLGSQLVFGLGVLFIGLRPSILLIGFGALVVHLMLPVNNVTNQAIWQSKVAAGAQGRVFAMRQMVAKAMTLLAFLLAGPLADKVFNPLLALHGPLAGGLGRLISVGPGRGIGLMFVIMGILTILTVSVGYFNSRLRLVEKELPDANETSFEPEIFGTGDAGQIARNITEFCSTELGSAIAECLFYQVSQGSVFGLCLQDGRRIVVKVHPPEQPYDFLAAVYRVQSHLAEHGFPCPRPIAGPASLVYGHATVEELVDVGNYADAHDPAIRCTMAETLFRLVDLTRDFTDIPGLQPGILTRQPGDALWPRPHSKIFDFEATKVGSEWIDQIASKARQALSNSAGQKVIGHTDWSVKHFRFEGNKARVIYDWDSLALEKEPVIVGDAARGFTMTWHLEVPLAPSLDELWAFVSEYETARGIAFTSIERTTIAASAAYALAYSARCENCLDPGAKIFLSGSFREALAYYGEKLVSFIP